MNLAHPKMINLVYFKCYMKKMLSLNIILFEAEQWLCNTCCEEHLPNQVFIRLFCFHIFNSLIQQIYMLLFIRNENLSDLFPGSMLNIPHGETRFNVSIINSGLAWEGLSSMLFFGMLMAVGHGFKCFTTENT